jgi:hypothetical protein
LKVTAKKLSQEQVILEKGGHKTSDDVLIKKREIWTEAHRDDSLMKTEAEIAVRYLQAKAFQALLTTNRNWNGAPRTNQPCRHLNFRPLAPRTMRK